jgi:hypothetical protein
MSVLRSKRSKNTLKEQIETFLYAQNVQNGRCDKNKNVWYIIGVKGREKPTTYYRKEK